jgi:chromosome segregation ATPase
MQFFKLISVLNEKCNERQRPTLEVFDFDDLSISSINTVALKRISDLKNKLEVQENTKIELLNQYTSLETELENVDRKLAQFKLLREENTELREQSAKVEHDLIKSMDQMMKRMNEREREYEAQLRERDQRIEKLKEDFHLLQIVKYIDPPSIVAVPHRRTP